MIEHVTEECACEGKLCKLCKKVVCVGKYPPRKQKGGLSSWCRECESERQRVWRERNAEKISTQKQIWYQNNRERRMAKSKAYYHANVARDRERRKAWKAANPDYYSQYNQARKEQQVAWRHERREIDTARIKKWHQEHYDHRLAKFRVYNANRRALRAGAGGSYTLAEWESLKARYDFTCLCCGRKEPEIKLTADHIIPIIKNGPSDISNIQPLCETCNSRKFDKVIDFRAQNP